MSWCLSKKHRAIFHRPRTRPRWISRSCRLSLMCFRVLKGTKVKFNNSDPVLHNVFWNKSEDGSYEARNLGTFGKGANAEFTFDKEGSVVLLCNVHPEMEGHIVVLQNPYFAVAGKDGAYEIKGVPAGQYSVKAWYPNPKKLKAKTAPATVTAGQATQLDFSLSRK